VGCIQARILLDKFGSASAIFQAKRSQLEHTEGIGTVRAEQIKKFSAHADVENEISFIEKFNIHPLFITNEHYPKRLLNCYDPPILLYAKGPASLNTGRMIAVVGTRNPTEYGNQLAEDLIHSIAPFEPTIISGLAFGIDAMAHRLSLKKNIPTIAVLAHGLTHIYPHQHRNLARQIIDEGGGLLTEFLSTQKPDKHHFPSRNRIVAGLCDAVIILESGIKGGSMVTAALAAGYNRDIYCFPGRIHDSKSMGCNKLIQQQQAQMLTCPNDLIEALGWKNSSEKMPARQVTLPLDLSDPERQVLELLHQKEVVTIDELSNWFKGSIPALSEIVLNLEMQGLIRSLPGKKFCCCQ
jgi:DNA processing protein